MAYLVKPFQKSDLMPAIELALARHAELTALRKENSDLAERLEARKLLDRAKGRLMDEHGLSEQAAFRFIQTTAMRERSTMRAVASRVVEGELVPDDEPTPDLP